MLAVRERQDCDRNMTGPERVGHHEGPAGAFGFETALERVLPFSARPLCGPMFRQAQEIERCAPRRIRQSHTREIEPQLAHEHLEERAQGAFRIFALGQFRTDDLPDARLSALEFVIARWHFESPR